MTELRCTVRCPNFVQQYICAYHLNLELAIISSFCILPVGGGRGRWGIGQNAFIMFFSSAVVLDSVWVGGKWTFLYWHWPAYGFGIALWTNRFSSYQFTFTGCFIMFQWLWFLLVFTQQCNYMSRFSRGFLLLLVFQTCFRYKRPKHRDFQGTWVTTTAISSWILGWSPVFFLTGIFFSFVFWNVRG